MYLFWQLPFWMFEHFLSMKCFWPDTFYLLRLDELLLVFKRVRFKGNTIGLCVFVNLPFWLLYFGLFILMFCSTYSWLKFSKIDSIYLILAIFYRIRNYLWIQFSVFILNNSLQLIIFFYEESSLECLIFIIKFTF